MARKLVTIFISFLLKINFQSPHLDNEIGIGRMGSHFIKLIFMPFQCFFNKLVCKRQTFLTLSSIVGKDMKGMNKKYLLCCIFLPCVQILNEVLSKCLHLKNALAYYFSE